MQTNTFQKSIPHTIKAEQKFLNALEEIFTPTFTAKIYPSITDGISEARINTEENLTTKKLVQLLKLAKKYNLLLEIKRSGAGLKIEFSQQ